jgi:hypothetical protein
MIRPDRFGLQPIFLKVLVTGTPHANPSSISWYVLSVKKFGVSGGILSIGRPVRCIGSVRVL